MPGQTDPVPVAQGQGDVLQRSRKTRRPDRETTPPTKLPSAVSTTRSPSAATCRFWPDDLSWPTWAAETAELALAYLTSDGVSADEPEPRY